MRIVYSRKNDNGVSIITSAPKEIVQRDLSAASHDLILRDIADGRLPADIARDPQTGLISLTDDQHIALVKLQGVHHEISSITVLDDSFELPSIEFRDAWTHDGKQFGHDLEKVIVIQLERLRAIRNPLLIKYDGLQARANDLNDGATLADLKIKKQQLRDATNALKVLVASTVNDIKKATPDLSEY